MKIKTILKITRRDCWLMATVAVLGLLVVMYWRPIQQRTLIHFVLRSDMVAQTTVDELASNIEDPSAFLHALWETGKVPHRLAVANYLSVHGGTNPTLLTRMEPLLEAAANDGDFEVRELTLRFLGLQHRTNALNLAKEQLHDPDPEARILALRYLRQVGDRSLIPWVARLLEDSSPRVASTAAAALRQWTDLDFGVRAAQTGLREDGSENANQADGGAAARGIQRWKEWWELHKTEYPGLPDPPQQAVSRWRLAIPDFSLRDLEGKSVRLSDFRGKVVLLNFWDTTTPACLLEMSNLTELQRRTPDRLVALGISLDTTADERSCESCEHEGEKHTNHIKPDIEELRAALRQIARQKGVNCRILIDSSGSVGRRFDANNLPTNVLIDPDGYVRRRFIGGRPPAVLGAMIDEIIKGLENPKK